VLESDFRQVHQQEAYTTIAGRGGAVKTMCNTPPLFKGSISVADCMPLSSLLETIKINGVVQCRQCIKTRFWMYICSITAGGNVLSFLDGMRPTVSTDDA